MKFPKSNWYNIFQIVQMFFHFFQSGQIWSNLVKSGQNLVKSGQNMISPDLTRFVFCDIFLKPNKNDRSHFGSKPKPRSTLCLLMGKAMKAQPLQKGKGVAMKAKPCKKAAAKAKTSCKKPGGGLKKSIGKKLSKQNLEKLGQMTLQEKLKKAGEEETTEDAKAVLQELMTKEEKNRLWGKHQTAMKSDPEEKEKYTEASKKEKGEMALLWLLKKEHPKFMHISREVEGVSAAKRKEKWVSESVMLTQWTWDELQAHLSSGRIVGRECPTTWGVWEYCDMHNWQTTQKAATKRKAKLGQEFQPNSDDEAAFDEWAKGNLQSNAGLLCNPSSGSKGLGKSQNKGKGKTKNQQKGKGRGKDQLALTNGDEQEEEDHDEEKTEEEELKIALKKAKKARDLTSAVCADFEDCLAKANQYLTKQAKQNGLKDQQVLVAMGTRLKDAVTKENLPIKKLKALLQENANKIKEVKETMKELKQLANKASSIASKASKK